MSATRPTGFPGWASGPSGYVTEPDATTKALGWQPTGVARSAYFNWLGLVTYQWLKYHDDAQGLHFGDTSDGSFVFDGVASGCAWATGPSGSAYLQTRDAYALEVAIASGVELQSGGWRLFADKFTATGTGRYTNNGGPGSNQASGIAGAPAPSNSVGGGASGGVSFGAGANATGASGLSVTNAFGGAGGTGGLGAGSAPGRGGAATGPAAQRGLPHTYAPGTWGHLIGGGTLVMVQGGAGGGAAANVSNVLGGPGGGGGGVLALAARSVNITSAASLQAQGGAGGSASGFTGVGGGGGGGGGVLLLAARKLAVATGPTPTGTISCAGGVGGAAGVVSGTTGSAGQAGQAFVIIA